MTTFAELRAKARAILQDDGNYWTDEELDMYLNEAQDEFCRHTRVLRGEHPLTTRENQAVYTLPEDHLETLRIVGKEGTEVTPTHSKSLHGTNLSTTGTGDPTHHYSDLDGDGKLRFYPQPKPTIETGPTEFEEGTKYLVELGLDVGTVNSIQIMDAFLYICDEANLYQYEISGAELILRDSVAHGVTVTDPVYLSVVPSAHYQPGNPAGGWNPDPGDVWLHHDDRTYRWRIGQGVSAFVFINDFFAGITQFPQTNGNYLGWVGVDGELYSRAGYTLAASEVASGITGLGPITYSEGDATGNITHALIGGTQYDMTDGVWSGPVPVTITDPRVAASAGWTEISSLTDQQSAIAEDGTLYVIHDSAVKKADAYDKEHGAIVYWNGSTFDQEFGTMVDLASDELVTFDSELGIVTSFITAEDVATVYYVRKPREGQVEISDPLALVWYAIARAYEQDGEQSHLARANYYAGKFRGIMGRTLRRVAGGFNGNDSPRKIRTY